MKKIAFKTAFPNNSLGLLRGKQIYLLKNEIVSLDINRKGLIFLYFDSYDSVAIVSMSPNPTNYSSIIHDQRNIVSLGKDDPGKVNIYRETHGGIIFCKNNSLYNLLVDINYMTV